MSTLTISTDLRAEIISEHERAAANRPARTAHAIRAGATSVAVRKAKTVA